MTWINRTFVIPDADKPLASAITDLFAGSPQHIFSFPLSPTGEQPPTHWLGSGPVGDGYEVIAPWQVWQWQPEDESWGLVEEYPGQPNVVYAACQQPISEDDPSPRVPCTLAEVEALFQAADITDQNPWVAMERLGLKPAYPPAPPLDTVE